MMQLSAEERRERKRDYMRLWFERHPEKRKQTRQWQLAHPEAIKKHRASYRLRHIEKLKDALKSYKKNNPEKIAEYERRKRQNHPDRIEARWKAEYYIPLGNKCEKCGSIENLERHHPDYGKPLEIMTLCRKCHSDELRRRE